MFWTAFVWGIGATAGGSVGLMLFVVLFAAWSYLMRTPAAVRSMELAELTYTAMLKTNELTEKQVMQLTSLAASAVVVTDFVTSMERIECETREVDGEENDSTVTEAVEDLCDHPHDDGSGFFG